VHVPSRLQVLVVRPLQVNVFSSTPVEEFKHVRVHLHLNTVLSHPHSRGKVLRVEVVGHAGGAADSRLPLRRQGRHRGRRVNVRTMNIYSIIRPRRNITAPRQVLKGLRVLGYSTVTLLCRSTVDSEGVVTTSPLLTAAFFKFQTISIIDYQ
jgi:hypothetical protein